jgi:hypothetical protein
VKGSVIDENVERFRLRSLVWETIKAATLLTYNPAGGSTKAAPLSVAMPGTRTADAIT